MPEVVVVVVDAAGVMGVTGVMLFGVVVLFFMTMFGFVMVFFFMGVRLGVLAFGELVTGAEAEVEGEGIGGGQAEVEAWGGGGVVPAFAGFVGEMSGEAEGEPGSDAEDEVWLRDVGVDAVLAFPVEGAEDLAVAGAREVVVFQEEEVLAVTGAEGGGGDKEEGDAGEGKFHGMSEIEWETGQNTTRRWEGVKRTSTWLEPSMGPESVFSESCRKRGAQRRGGAVRPGGAGAARAGGCCALTACLEVPGWDWVRILSGRGGDNERSRSGRSSRGLCP